MGGGIKAVVVDASVVLAFLLAEPEADRYLEEMVRAQEGKIDLLAPTLQFYEILNGIETSVLRKRIERTSAGEIWERYLGLGIHLHDQSEQGGEIMELSIKLDLTGYDAAYVVMARRMGTGLLSLDEKMEKLAAVNE